MNTPQFDAHTHSVCRDPSLIGTLTDGSLIDLDGGVITFEPNQQLQWSMNSARVQDGRHIYHLTFTKRSGSPWIKWFNENSEARFKIGGLTFVIDSAVAAPTDHEMTYTARSIL